MRVIACVFCMIYFYLPAIAQDQVVVLSTDMFKSHQKLQLAPLDEWVFKSGDDSAWSDPEYDASDWDHLNPTMLSAEMGDKNGRIEGWFRLTFKLDSSFTGMPLYISRDLWAATDIYINGELVHSFGDTGNPYTAYNPTLKYPRPIDLEPGKKYLIAVHFVDYETTFTQRELRLKSIYLQDLINLTGPDYNEFVVSDIKLAYIFGTLTISITFLLSFLYWLLVFLNPGQNIFKWIAWMTTFTLLAAIGSFYQFFTELSYDAEKIRFIITISLQPIATIFGLLILEWLLTNKVSLYLKSLVAAMLVSNFFAHLFSILWSFAIFFFLMIGYYIYLIYSYKYKIRGAIWAVIIAMIFQVVVASVYITVHKYSLEVFNEYDKLMTSMLQLGTPLLLLVYISIRFRETLDTVKKEAEKVLKVTEEKKALLENQNVVLEEVVEERTRELHESLKELKSTQNQLIQQERLASLGELTAGIAHEIQNPLNFVNNFSEVNNELIDEQLEEIEKGDLEEIKELALIMKENGNKINHHGQRADDIVKSMLQHSRVGSGEKELTNINSLADEYLRLSYHGLRAKDSSFNAEFKADLDPDLPEVNVIPQDIGRVLLNLINNAFQACSNVEKPLVQVSTKRTESGIQISVRDNGPGIPDKVKDKIFQPFFTTKPTGQGTGLGLSLSYDIVKAHGGKFDIETVLGEYTIFKIILKNE